MTSILPVTQNGNHIWELLNPCLCKQKRERSHAATMPKNLVVAIANHILFFTENVCQKSVKVYVSEQLVELSICKKLTNSIMYMNNLVFHWVRCTRWHDIRNTCNEKERRKTTAHTRLFSATKASMFC